MNIQTIEVYRDPHSRKKQPRVTSRLQDNNCHPALLTVQHLNSTIIDNQELKLVLSMVKTKNISNFIIWNLYFIQQEQTLNRLLDQFNNLQMGMNSISGKINSFQINKCLFFFVEVEPFELERLIVSDDEAEEEEDDESSSTLSENHM